MKILYCNCFSGISGDILLGAFLDAGVEQVHFHEIGALDSIIDIIGAVICFESISANKIYTSAVNVGKGIVKCAHGLLPVPAPATLAIAKTLLFLFTLYMQTMKLPLQPEWLY